MSPALTSECGCASAGPVMNELGLDICHHTQAVGISTDVASIIVAGLRNVRWRDLNYGAEYFFVQCSVDLMNTLVKYSVDSQ